MIQELIITEENYGKLPILFKNQIDVSADPFLFFTSFKNFILKPGMTILYDEGNNIISVKEVINA